MKDLLPLSPPSAYPAGRKLNFPQKLGRLRERMHDPEWRRYGGTLLGGKLLGVGVVLLFMLVVSGVFFTSVHAQSGTPEVKASDIVNPVNTMWTLVAAFLVFGMQVGFVMLEAGFARSRESINILVEGIVNTCICGVTFWAWGFAFMFEPGNGFIGTTGFFLRGLPETYGSTGIPLLYRLKDRERWTLLDCDCVMVVHPDRSAKVVYPDGRVEEIASKGDAYSR